MTEPDLLNLAHTYNQDISSAFGQIVTITFAMIVGIYYFLNQAKLGLKIFAFAIYTVGMFLYFSLMIVASNVGLGVFESLQAMPQDQLSRPAVHLLAVRDSWVGTTESVLITG
ncbi:MAG TPA: hypothetical protein VHW02_12090, partial [Rhizomicrobium sp.]|nr:hypothetical protein [Rhizomicrobium sp.]